MTELDVGRAALTLQEARLAAAPVPQLTTESDFDLTTAYAVQAAGIGLRTDAGEVAVGVKLGLTSRAKMQQVGVSEVIFGQLTDAMSLGDGESVGPGGFVHPRIEPEVAFRLARTVGGDEPLDIAVTAFDAVAPALEIIDSRYADFQFTLSDVVSDNASAAGYLLGSWLPYGPAAGGLVDISNRAVVLDVDGVTAQVGSTAAILGDPARALRATIVLARRYGVALSAGSVVLAGAATAAVALTAQSTVRCTVAGLGSVAVSVGSIR